MEKLESHAVVLQHQYQYRTEDDIVVIERLRDKYLLLEYHDHEKRHLPYYF